jgi:hypothetical protein
MEIQNDITVNHDDSVLVRVCMEGGVLTSLPHASSFKSQSPKAVAGG